MMDRRAAAGSCGGTVQDYAVSRFTANRTALFGGSMGGIARSGSHAAAYPAQQHPDRLRTSAPKGVPPVPIEN